MKGFVTFEGIEGCGKSTQAALLADCLEKRGIPFLLTREPGGTEIGGKIRRILLDTANREMTSRAELLLYAADRAQHMTERILPALEEGKIVLCDRFTDATVAYQGFGRGLDGALIDELNGIASGGVSPALTFFVDCPVDVGLERAHSRDSENASGEMRFENEAKAFHERVMKGYREIARKENERVVTVDGNRPVEDIRREIEALFFDRVKLQ